MNLVKYLDLIHKNPSKEYFGELFIGKFMLFYDLVYLNEDTKKIRQCVLHAKITTEDNN